MSYYATSQKGSRFGNNYEGLSDYVKTKQQLFAIIGQRCSECEEEYDMEDLEAHHPDIDGHEDIARFKTRVSMYRYYVKNPQEAREKLAPICLTCHTGLHNH